MLLLAAVLAGATGCASSPDSSSSWRSDAGQIAHDVAGQLAITRVAMQAREQDRLPTAYATMTTTNAQDSGLSSIDDFADLYPPPELFDMHDEIAALLREAGDLLVRSRIAMAGDGDPATLIEQTADLQKQLLDEERKLQ
ncbi:hypothetical protein [Cumulibacter manganitolerans]|uniref:hypothetical protein n=1 Tax=Cumulibacter manganitolerans TaxID=1884992 RepID=UPI001297AE39|nr:hypothetical protein [Cumulibacter manganitolerans]